MFQFLPISRKEQNGRVIRFAERWAGEGFVCVPEGGVTMVQYTISTRVYGDVLKVFWSYCSEVGFIEVPRNNKSCICAMFLCGSVVEHCVSSAKGCGFDSQGTHTNTNEKCIT